MPTRRYLETSIPLFVMREVVKCLELKSSGCPRKPVDYRRVHLIVVSIVKTRRALRVVVRIKEPTITSAEEMQTELQYIPR